MSAYPITLRNYENTEKEVFQITLGLGLMLTLNVNLFETLTPNRNLTPNPNFVTLLEIEIIEKKVK